MTAIDGAEPVRVAVIGAGGRGTSHSRRIRRAGGIIAAVAEPDAGRRDRLGDAHDVPPALRFADWRDLARHAPDAAEAVLITTQDADHADPCVRFAELGRHVLCEKPMAPTEAEANRMVDAVEAAGVVFAVLHSMRYTPYTDLLREILRSGAIGDVVCVQHLEPVGAWHFAHSYVRGSWRREDESSSMLMAKCVHDLDLLAYLIGSFPTAVASFGRLTHFRPDRRPAAAADRCLDCALEPECPYSAPRLYRSCLGDPRWEHWPLGAVTATPTAASLDAALATGPYGRCVYACDNDVADHQVVALDFANGVTATHTVTAFTTSGLRRTQVFGTHGSIEGDGIALTVNDFRGHPRESRRTHTPGTDRGPVGAHDDGDQNAVRAFLTAVATGDRSTIRSGARESVDSHRIVWAAEQARRTNTTVELRTGRRGGPTGGRPRP